MNILNKDLVNCVKNIADCNRCTICDKLREPCVKFWCGHSVCQDCVVRKKSCSLCFSSTPNLTYISDEPRSLRVKHASDLVTAFQDLYNVDVNRRSRLSERMKLEKQLFPNCIQAPVKYSNRRKTIIPKNLTSPVSVLPGEVITKHSPKMNSKFEYIQQWLKNTDNSSCKSRAPLRDLNINHVNKSNKNNEVTYNVIPSKLSKKRKYVDENVNRKLKKRNKCVLTADNTNTSLNSDVPITEKDQNDSGILIIDNSQMENVDKDKLACLVVKEAEILKNKNRTMIDDSLISKTFSKTIQAVNTSESKMKSIYKISFNKKSLLFEICKLCSDFESHIGKTNKTSKPNDFNITVESNYFIANICVSNNIPINTKETSMKSVEVQTNLITHSNYRANNDNSSGSEEFLNIKEVDNAKSTVKHESIEKNDAIDKNNLHNELSVTVNLLKKFEQKDNTSKRDDTLGKCTIVEESDSSNMDVNSDIGVSQNVIEVSADIHRSSNIEDYVLRTLHENEYGNRTRHVARGNTPDSSNSSDKENFDPNRMKSHKILQKKCYKKF